MSKIKRKESKNYLVETMEVMTGLQRLAITNDERRLLYKVIWKPLENIQMQKKKELLEIGKTLCNSFQDFELSIMSVIAEYCV